MELELQLEVTREAQGKVGARFWVLSAEGGGGRGSAATHHVTITLKPVGGPLVVGSEEAEKPE